MTCEHLRHGFNSTSAPCELKDCNDSQLTDQWPIKEVQYFSNGIENYT